MNRILKVGGTLLFACLLSTALYADGGSGSGGNTNVKCISGCLGTSSNPSSVDVVSSVLPTGAATSAKQDTLNTTAGSLFKAGQSIGNTSFGATQSGTWTVQPGNTANTTAWKVTGAGGTFPVTGTFWQTTQPVSAASLPLPTGAATAAGLTTINSTLGSPFQAGGSIGNTVFGATQSGTWNIGNITGTISLPTGAATAAKQPALGSAGTASSDVLSVQGISGGTSLNVNCASGCASVAQSTADTYDLTSTDYNTTPIGAQATTAAPSLTNGNIYTLSQTTAGGLRVDGSGTTQPVSGTFWQTTQPVSGPLTDTQLRATAVPVSATQSGSWSVSLPSGASTSALQTTGNTKLDTINTSIGTSNSRLNTINTTLGTPFQAGGSIGNTSFGVSSLPSIPAGTNLIGSVGIDQTTSGSTNAVTVVPIADGTVSPSTTVTPTVASSRVVKTSAGNLYGFSGNSTVAGYWLVFDATAAPGDGTVTPVKCYPYPVPERSFAVSWGALPLHLTNGIAIAFSTTGCFTKTASATAFISAEYK